MIFIEYDLNNQSGKGKFIQRLTAEWDRMGVKYSDKPEGCGVRFAITRSRTKWKGPTVIRIDGAHAEFNLNVAKYKLSKREAYKKLAWKNRETGKDIMAADAVIWQSMFCYKMGRHVFDVRPRKNHIIFNGDNPADYLPRTLNKNIVMSAKWRFRPHKRLQEMLEICSTYCDKHPEIKVRVLGGIEEKVPKHPSIEYLGMVDMLKMKEVFADSAVMLNLAYFDWCPNAVVEALVSGMPVICTANHGVSEIVGGSGIVLPLDAPIPRDIARACDPPEFEYGPVYDALDRVLYGQEQFDLPTHLYIEKIAKKYLEVFNDVAR